jgi:ABC-type transporter Mla subunit MlaD
MKTKQQDFILGLVILGVIAVFVGTFLFVYPHYGGPTKKITVRFKHEEGVAPLKEGSPVSLGGAMQVGKVTALRRDLVRNDKPGLPPSQLLIVVEARIDEDLPLYRDCEISTDQPPVGGGGTLVILSIGSSDKGLVGETVIDGLPPQSLAAAISGLSRRLLAPDGLVDNLTHSLDERHEGSLMNKLTVSMTDINAMTADLRIQLSAREQKTLMSKLQIVFDNFAEMTSELREQVKADNAAGLIAKVHVALDVLGRALAEANDTLHENRPGLRNTVASVERMARTLDEDIINKLRADFDRENPKSLLGKLHHGMDQLDVSLDNITAVTDSTRNFVVVNRPALDRMVENLKAMTDQMRTAVQELVLQPWRLLQPPGSELKRLDVFEAARNFASAAAMLDDATARLEAIVKAAPTDGRLTQSDEEIREIQAGLKKAFERYRVAENYLFEKLK